MMNRKLKTIGIFTIACIFSLMSYVYVETHTPKTFAKASYSNVLDQSFQEKTFMPEVQFVCKVFKSIFEISNFR